MPQIGAAIVGAFVVFGKTVAANGLISALFTTAVGKAILSVGAFALQAAFRPRIDFNDDAGEVRGQELRVRFQTNHPITVLVGRTATAGHVVFASSRGPADDPTRYLTRVFVLSDYQCAAVNRVWGDGEALTFNGNLTTGWRECTSHYQGEDGENRLRMRVYLGSESQAADSELDSQYTQITSDFRLRGKAYAIVECDYDPEFAFKNGEPQLLWEIDGAPCYDPREVAHDPDDASTWAFTENAALITAQFYAGWKRAGKVILGPGWARSRIPDADLIAAANECDEAISLKAGGSIARYRAGGALYSARPHRSNLTELIKAMDGEVDDTAGEVRILPGVERATVMEIKWADILAAETIELDPEFDPADGMNRVLARYPEPENLYEPLDLPARTDAAFVSSDGGEDLTLSTEFGLVPYGPQAQRLAKRILERGRAQRRLSVTMRLKYIVLEKGDRVTLDAELRSKLRLPETNWRIETRPEFSVDGDSGLAIKLMLREHPDSIGNWTPSTDELDEDSATITRPGDPALSVPGLAVAAVTVGASGFQYPSGRVTWTATSVAVRVVQIELRESQDDTTRQQFSARPSSLQQTLGRLAANTVYEIRARAYTSAGPKAWSSWLSFTSGAVDTATGVDWNGVSGSGKPADNATVGADWSVNVGNRPANISSLTGTEDILNGDIVIAADGTLSGAGGGQVTIGGLGYTGALDATAGATWGVDVASRPAELTDGRVSTAIATGGKILVDGYEVNKFFSGSPSALTSITDANATGIVLARVDLDDARAINLWSLLGTDIVFGTHQTGTMGAGETANFELEVWYTNPDASPVALGGNFGSVGVTAYQVATSGALDWSIILSDTGSITIKSEIISGNPTITNDKLNDEIGLQNIKFPSAALGAAHVYLVGRWIGTDSASSTGIALRFTTNTTLAVTNLINRSTS